VFKIETPNSHAFVLLFVPHSLELVATKLQLGDPTLYDNLSPCKAALEAVAHALVIRGHAAGYVNACGTPEARHAIARYHSYPEHRITSDNVIIANGCSGALELALTALLDPGTAVLVPQPGFPLYQVIAESHGASVVPYRLLPEQEWQVDLDHLEELMVEHPNQTIRAMILNNPSNPTGSVFSQEHLMELLDFAHRHHLPIVSDEVYGELVFANQTFHPMALVAAKHGRRVPVITASGLAKQFLLPGWRVGWLTFHDK
jgi:tyrosine aminotransferase